MSTSLQALLDQLPQIGRVKWIGIRPPHQTTASGQKLKMPMQIIDAVEARLDSGLVGDRYNGKNGKRHVTLIQWEHLPVIASLIGRESVAPELLRRNIAIEGINLLALKDKQFRIGTALLEYTGLCDPCSAMENTFGAGGYNAVRGHGGITARIIEAGVIRLNDSISINNIK